MRTTSGEKVRVAIVDDHAIMRAGLKLLINSQPDMQVVGEAAKAGDIGALVMASSPDVMLLDIGMPGISGVQALKGLRAAHPKLRVVILTMHSDIALVRSALCAGAAGFVLKQAADTELLSALRAVWRGGVFVDPSLAGALLPFGTAVPSSRELLSDRERQVLKLVAQGHSSQDIADRIRISLKTVETYRARIADKLGLRGRRDFTRYALATGLLSSEDVLQQQNPAA